MVKTRNSGIAAKQKSADICFMCNGVTYNNSEVCYHCVSTLKAICGNKNNLCDKLLGDGIKIGKASKRRARVKKMADQLGSGYKSLKEKFESQRSENKALKEKVRYLGTS